MVGQTGHLREHIMKKSTIIKKIIIAVLFGAIILTTPLLFLVKTPREKKTQEWSSTIEINDRTLTPADNNINFSLDKAGDYNIYFSLIPDGFNKDSMGKVKLTDIGFVTTLTVTNEEDEIVYSSTQGAIFLDTVIFLEPGNYKVTYHYFNNEEEFYDYQSTYIVGSKEAEKMTQDIDFPSFKENGKTVINYEFCCLSKEEGLVFPSILLVWGILVGLLFGLFMVEFVFNRKEGETKYDERQILEQGKAFKIGFFVMFITVEALIILNVSGLADVGDYAVFYQAAVFLGLLTYVVYCIWTESYFAINQKSTSIIISFAFIALVNLLIGIANIIHGQMIVDGKITFRILNPLCAVLFVVIFATMLLKRIVNAKNSSADEEEEDDDEES